MLNVPQLLIPLVLDAELDLPSKTQLVLSNVQKIKPDIMICAKLNVLLLGIKMLNKIVNNVISIVKNVLVQEKMNVKYVIRIMLF